MDRERLNQLTLAQAGLLSWRQMEAAGMPRHRLRLLEKQGRMRRYVRGVYHVLGVAAEGFDVERSRAAWAGLLATAPHGISTGACALHLHGVQGLPQQLRPEVAVPMNGSGRGVEGVRVRRIREFFEYVEIHGRRVAAPIPAMVQALPELCLERAVAVVDSALNREILSDTCVITIREALRGKRGASGLAACWGLVDGRAASPVETNVRLECVAGGVPPTDLQVVLQDDHGGFVARGDLGWLRPDGTWVLVEVDGVSVHDQPQALFHDRDRQNRIMLTGRHTTLRFTARDLGTGRIVRQIAQALRM